MASVLKISDQFSAKHLGNAMARLWNVDAMLLRTTPFVDAQGTTCECPMTLESITTPALIQAGGVYQMGFITR